MGLCRDRYPGTSVIVCGVAYDVDVTSGIADIESPSSTLSAPITSKVFFGAEVVEFERTTLVEIQKAAGVGSIQRHGDAGESESWLCYTFASNGEVARIWLSAGELGGPESAIGSVVVEVANGARTTADCPKLPNRLTPVSSGTAVWLDMHVNWLKSQLGEPAQRKGGWWLYSYSGKIQSGRFDRLSIFGARIVNGKISALFLSQGTTTN
jgi:hypothetical protein